MNYMFLPLDQQFDLGFGVIAESFKDAGDAVSSPDAHVANLNAHLPASFLYRHAIELFLKSGILIFHKKFRLPYGEYSFDSDPRVLINNEWKPMYSVHGIKNLYDYFSYLISSQSSYLAEHTRTNWTLPTELDGWISEIEAMDSSSTFFRYPITKHRDQDKNKSIHKEESIDAMLTNVRQNNEPLKAFLVVGTNDEIKKSFRYDTELSKSMTAILSKAADLLSCCHFAMRAELTGGW